MRHLAAKLSDAGELYAEQNAQESVASSRGRLPRITIVTPNLNGENFLDDTIGSLLSQRYPNLEYMVIDGGSSDASRDIIRKHEHEIDYWLSESDRGHAHALNKGFDRASGEIMGWLNSDDLLLGGALWTVAEIFASFPEVDWLTSALPAVCDDSGEIIVLKYPGFSRRFFERGGYCGQTYSTAWIQQESTFWRRSLWDRAGGRLDESLSLAIDFELWNRFFAHARLASVAAPLGCFRIHGDQRSTRQYDRYCAEALGCIGNRKSWLLAMFAKLWRTTRLCKLVSWRRVMALCYGENIERFSKANDGRWRRDVRRVA